MVIEAIVTDTGEFGYVRLSYSAPVQGEENPDYQYENGAQVLVIDDLGDEFVFSPVDSGFYVNNTFRPAFDRSYRLEVQVNQNRFVSDWEKLAFDQVDAPEVSYRPETKQVLNDRGNPIDQNSIVISERITRQDNDLRYHWRFKHFYIFDAYGQPELLPFLPGIERFCYVQDQERPELMIHEDRAGFGNLGPAYNLDITTIPFGREMVYDYAIQVIRFNISEKAYQYLDKIREQIENNGGVFDSAPAEIEGNLTRLSGNLDVLGFFGVFNVSSSYLFFNQEELPFEQLAFPTFDDHCARAPEGIDSLNFPCWNCKAFESDFNSVEKPAWWR